MARSKIRRNNLVVDNCVFELHQRLRSEMNIQIACLSLLTLDYDPESCDDCNFIQIKTSIRGCHKGDSKTKLSSLQDLDINRIVESLKVPQNCSYTREALRNNVHDIRKFKR